MRNVFRFLTILLLNVFSVQVDAKVMKVAFGKSKPPYIYEEDGVVHGIEVDLVREILKKLKTPHEFKSLSYLRLETEASHGDTYDMIVGVRNREGGRYYSHAFMDHEVCAFSLKSRKLSVKSPKDLQSLKVAVWRAAWKDLGPDFKRIFEPGFNGKVPENLVEYPQTKDRFASLYKGEVDVLVMDRFIFDWYRLMPQEGNHFTQDVKVHEIFPENTPAYVSFRDEKTRDAFNRELKRLRDSGDYARMVKAYTGERVAGLGKK